ncbi:MAG: hypothetical protein IJU98_03045 [Synergistaceae bacterium]|nr:hypothetical protein [Synergistaceae bacterium]
MLSTDTATEAAVQENFLEYCSDVESGGKVLFVTREGKPEVVMLSAADYRAMADYQDRTTQKREEKWRAYEAMETMKKRSPFPKDYDYDAAREEAFLERHGRFD